MMNEKLKIQLEERDKFINILQRQINNLEIRFGERISYDFFEIDIVRQIRGEIEVFYDVFRNIVEVVINDVDEFDGEEGRRFIFLFRVRFIFLFVRVRFFMFRDRFKFFMVRFRFLVLVDVIFFVVQVVLNKRQFQLFEVRVKLRVSQDYNVVIRKQMDDLDNERRRMELQILQLKEDVDIL